MKKRISTEALNTSPSKKRKLYQPFCHDVLRIILTFLEPGDICNSSLVCKEWRKMSKEDSIWRHIFEERFDGKIYDDLDVSLSYYQLYKISFERLNQTTPLIGEIPPIHEQLWKSLTTDEKQDMFESYFQQAIDNFAEDEVTEALLNFNLASNIVERLIKESKVANIDWNIYSCLFKQRRAQIYVEFGYAKLAMQEILVATQELVHLLPHNDSSQLSELLLEVSHIRARLSVCILSAHNLLQNFENTCEFAGTATFYINKSIESAETLLSRLQFLHYSAIVSREHIKALYKLKKWKELANIICLTYNRFVSTCNLRKQVRIQEGSNEGVEYKIILQIYSDILDDIRCKWKRKFNEFWIKELKGPERKFFVENVLNLYKV